MLGGFPAFLVPIPWFLARPIRALYLFVAASVVIEVYPLGFKDGLTDQIFFFGNLNFIGFAGVSISPMEILLVLALIAWLVHVRPDWSSFKPGKLFAAYAIFMGFVLMAEIHGLLTGGDLNLSLWELRPQVYGFIIFLLAATLIRDRSQVLWIAMILFIGAGFKAAVGLYRFYITLGGDIGGFDAILSHEESYFLALFLTATVAAIVWYRRKLVLLLIVISPFVTVALLENRRRAATLALGAALLVVVLLGIRFEAIVRKRLAIVAILAAVVVGGFVAVNWNHEFGLTGQIVRPVRSMFQPDDRDFLSNLYRTYENANITETYHSSRLIGIGFGKPMEVIFPLADISAADPLWQYIPHNSLLWIPMRMGILGFAAFWALIGMVVLEGVHSVRTNPDRLLRGVTAFALAAIVAELVVAYGDVQLENYRNMIFFGAMLGLIDAMPRIALKREAEEPALERKLVSDAPLALQHA